MAPRSRRDERWQEIDAPERFMITKARSLLVGGPGAAGKVDGDR